ncbi:MAG: glycoside hydrolase family 20 protein [Phocaeicola sp.]|uniref:glycoside hydrolase family 20 protein n=1 Tax=Phocaeicola sp. TaxID=2773926 RepID=UPI003FA12BDF
MSDLQAQNIIPKPNNIVMGSGQFELNSQTKLYTNLKGQEKLLMDKYLQTLPFHFTTGKAKDKANVIKLLIEPLQTQNQEAYQLSVTPEEVIIKGNAGAGLFYGLQTMTQLGVSHTPSTMNIPCAIVNDEPRFVHRGYMLDVSRHFFDKNFIIKMLDILSFYKINTFHWHLVDTGGWRIQIDKYPKLTELAAYRSFSDLNDWWKDHNRFCKKDSIGAYGGFYTKQDIKEIVAYATAHHINIIPEIDMPGHSRDVLWAYPELACQDKNANSSNELCIGNEKTFRFCEDVLIEIMELFPSKYIHIGGDEANRNIWKDCSLCKKRMEEEHLTEVANLQNYFTNRMEKFLAKHGRTMIGWDEILDGDVSQNAVVMSWREEVDGGGEALRKGHRVIMSPTSHCYLDYYQDCPYFEPQGLLGYIPLKKIYNFEPMPTGNFDQSLVLGVQGNLWTEHVPTTNDAEYKTFPRMQAIAEIGWTQPELKDYDNFRTRALAAMDYLKEKKSSHPFNLRTEIGPRMESLQPCTNLAKGKKVSYLAPYDSSFAGSKEATLTDGWLGDWNGNGDRWQGFVGNMDVVIDMETPTEIQAIGASFLFVPTGGQYLPDSIEISISDDGKKYKTLKKMGVTSDYSILFHIYTFAWTGQEKARYIRYHATKPITWGDILCDEIIIK